MSFSPASMHVSRKKESLTMVKSAVECRQNYDIAPYSYAMSSKQAPLVLLHTDWAVANAEPISPHMVAIGAITAAPAEALPRDLESFMQSAGEHGVVYASLGTTAIPGERSNLLFFFLLICLFFFLFYFFHALLASGLHVLSGPQAVNNVAACRSIRAQGNCARAVCKSPAEAL